MPEAKSDAPARGQMLSRHPSKVAQTLLSDFESGRMTREIYADPYVVRHCYEDFDKLKTLSKPIPTSGPGPRWADVTTESVRVIDGGEAITVLLVNRIRTMDGREFLHQSASVNSLNAEGKICRSEAYYDPHEQRRDAFLREHLAMYDGVVES